MSTTTGSQQTTVMVKTTRDDDNNKTSAAGKVARLFLFLVGTLLMTAAVAYVYFITFNTPLQTNTQTDSEIAASSTSIQRESSISASSCQSLFAQQNQNSAGKDTSSNNTSNATSDIYAAAPDALWIQSTLILSLAFAGGFVLVLAAAYGGKGGTQTPRKNGDKPSGRDA